MKKTGYILASLTAVSALHNPFTCDQNPKQIPSFDPTKYAGLWYMHMSTQFNKEKFGCVTLEFSDKPDTASKQIDSRFTYVKTFDWNLYATGKAYNERYNFKYSDASGELKGPGLKQLPSKQQIILEDHTAG